MTDRKWDFENQQIDHKKLKTDMDAFGVVIRFTCFLDNVNFLMTKYNLVDSNIHTVIENETGDTLQFSSLLCGYAGHGTSSTIKTMVLLGIPLETSIALCQNNRGLQITFPFNGYTNNETWFESTPSIPSIHLIHLGNHVFTSIHRRVLVFSQAELSLKEVLSCFHVMKPSSFRYSLDKSAPLIRIEELMNSGLLPWIPPDREAQLREINLIIHGEKFELYCGFSPDALVGTINAIYFYLTGLPLIFENRVSNAVVYTKQGEHRLSMWKHIRGLLSKNQIKLQDTKQIDIPELGKQWR